METYFIRFSRRAFVLLIIAVAPSWCGCNGTDQNLGKVSGKLTVNGEPLADAILIFSPTHAGKPSAGRTDSDGNYSLVYSADKNGAEIGEHHVWISTRVDEDEDSDPPTPAVPEKVPAKYLSGKELKVEIKQGNNEIDFPLES